LARILVERSPRTLGHLIHKIRCKYSEYSRRLQTLLPVIGIAVTGLSTHLCMAQAFRYGDAIVVVPLDFLRVPLIALIGWSFYGEALDALVLAGSGLIIAGVIWNLRTEARADAGSEGIPLIGKIPK
jgi:drug/metabolite transporter (DMT)-like permease